VTASGVGQEQLTLEVLTTARSKSRRLLAHLRTTIPRTEGAKSRGWSDEWPRDKNEAEQYRCQEWHRYKLGRRYEECAKESYKVLVTLSTNDRSLTVASQSMCRTPAALEIGRNSGTIQSSRRDRAYYAIKSCNLGSISNPPRRWPLCAGLVARWIQAESKGTSSHKNDRITNAKKTLIHEMRFDEH